MNTRRKLLAGLAVAILLATASRAHADWYAEGVRVASNDGDQSDPVLAPDDAGGAFIAWQDRRSGATEIFAQHLTANGSPAPGWPIDGILVAPAGSVDPIIARDARGGAFVAATYGGYYGGITLWHLPSGAPSASIAMLGRVELPHEALPADAQKTSPSVLPVLLPDEQGGVFLAWEAGGHLSEYVVLQHYHAGDPTSLSTQPTLLVGYGHAPAICSDGAAGLFVTNWELTVQHVIVHGDSVTLGWPNWTPVTPPHGYPDAPGIVADDAGGALVFWEDPRQVGRQQVYAQHLTVSGAVAAGWPADGLPICTFPTVAGLTRYSASSRTQHYSVVASDGAGGAYVAWQDLRADLGDIYLQRVLPDGTFAPGWTANGVPVCRATGTQQIPSIASDGSGGAFVCWQDGRTTASQVFVQHVLASGVPDPAWPNDGAPACSDPSSRALPRLITNPGQGPLLAWQDSRFGPNGIFATRLTLDGSLAPVGPCYIGVSVTTAVADSGTIHIVWQLTHDDTTSAMLYCRQVDGPWMPIERRAPDLSGRIDYSDREGLAGCRYGYALGIRTCGSPEEMLGVLWVDVPAGHGFPTLPTFPRETLQVGGPLRLTWDFPGGEGLTAVVTRRDSCSSWVPVDTLTVSEAGEAVYEESPLFDGQSRAYQLQTHVCGRDVVLPEWWVQVPAQGFTPTDATLTSASADAAGTHLAWHMESGPPSLARIYRRTTSSWWTIVRVYSIDAGETIEFNDIAVKPSTRYEYCLGVANCSTEPIFGYALLNTPAAVHPPVPLALRGGWPNPSRAGLTLSFALSSAEPARLEVFDAGGRMVKSAAVGSLGPGDHVLTLGDSRLDSGIYLVRLTQSGHTLTTRVTLLR